MKFYENTPSGDLSHGDNDVFCFFKVPATRYWNAGPGSILDDNSSMSFNKTVASLIWLLLFVTQIVLSDCTRMLRSRAEAVQQPRRKISDIFRPKRSGTFQGRDVPCRRRFRAFNLDPRASVVTICDILGSGHVFLYLKCKVSSFTIK